MMSRGDSLCPAPSLTRSSIIALSGATPVPGPTNTTGVSLSSGRHSVGGEILIATFVPRSSDLSQEEQSPRRGALRLVWYSTIATRSCTSPGWDCLSVKFSAGYEALCRTLQGRRGRVAEDEAGEEEDLHPTSLLC